MTSHLNSSKNSANFRLILIDMLPNLYALRFILALFVIIYHIPRFSQALGYPFYYGLSFFSKGSLAVYYFFSLSGFLIIRLIYLEINKTKKFNFKAFYIRRIQRLYPVYYLVFFIGILLFHVILPQFGIYRNLDYAFNDLLFYYVFFMPNVFIHSYNPGIILTVLWSIGVEEQFYLFAPLILYIGRKRLILTIAVSLFIAIGIFFINSELYKYQNFFFYFLFGGLCSVVSENYRFSVLKNKYFHFIIYIAFICSFFLNMRAIESDLVYHGLNVIISGILITLISYYPIFNIKNSMINYFGKISYGIYMYHMIVLTGLFFLIEKLFVKESINPVVFIVLLNVISIGLTILLSHFSFSYFEKLFYKSKMIKTQKTAKQQVKFKFIKALK